MPDLTTDERLALLEEKMEALAELIGEDVIGGDATLVWDKSLSDEGTEDEALIGDWVIRDRAELQEVTVDARRADTGSGHSDVP